MQDQKKATLQTIFSDVLADLAFMFTDDDLVMDTDVDPIWYETQIGYEGPVSGTLRFRCPAGFATLLAGNLLGTSPEDDDAEFNARDAVKEFMNIVCGQFITAVHGTEDVYNLTIPEIGQIETISDFDGSEDWDTSRLCVENHRVELAYRSGLDARLT